MSKPRKEHWNAMKHICSYLKGKTDVELVYHGDTFYAFVGYSYFDYVANLDARRSVMGYAFTIDNSLISWKATLHPTMTLSTIKAE